MLDQALKDAQFLELQKEIDALRGRQRNLTSTMHAQHLAMYEYLDANIKLKAATFLLEDDIKKLNGQMGSLIERVQTLESEKADLLKKIDSHQSISDAA